MQTAAQPAAIRSFSGPHRFLSNFFPSIVTLDGDVYPTVEHAFQAAKVAREEREPFMDAATPGDAKRLGRRCRMRPDWEAVKDGVMLDLLRSKFVDPALRAKLSATGDAPLEEGNTWGDRYWGTVNGVGKNMLGKLLMEVREELAAQAKQARGAKRKPQRPSKCELLAA
jgi:ribA/ribD-fused uncharacterized protein